MASAVKFSATDRERIIAEARARAEGARQDVVPPREAHRDDADPIALSNAAKATFARHKAEQAAALPEVVYKTVERRSEVAAPIDYATMMDDKIAAERATMRDAIAEFVVEMQDAGHKKAAQERKTDIVELQDTIRSLQFELAETKTMVADLRMLLANERAKVIDLPNQSARHRVQ